jgi:extracellular factor (EF) 3-hydroxypalmitic acid methyl ester biosynthesis protein
MEEPLLSAATLSNAGALLRAAPCQNNGLHAQVGEWAEWSDALERAASWLNGVHSRIVDGGDVGAGMASLHESLSLLRRKWDREEWRRFCLEIARNHPLLQVLHRCPFTRHGFTRPRGYAGDAALIDYLYTERLVEECHPGALIYHFMYQQPSPRSVRERRLLLARELDEVAERVHRPRILSMACGHLREAELSRAVKAGRIGELIALDQDALSLAEVARQHPAGLVHTHCDSVRSILQGRTRFEGLDLAYSAGLYDYLAEGTAQRLTRLLFGMLRPNGRLVVANFATCPEAGYLEAFMDWWLVYREEAQVQAFTAEIPPEQIASQHMFRDSERNVIYLQLTRR